MVCAAVVSACWGVSSAWAGGDGSIRFHENYAEALREAKESGKPIFLEFRCAP